MKSNLMISSFLKDVVVVHMAVCIEQFGYLGTIKKLLSRNCYHLILRSEKCHFLDVFFTALHGMQTWSRDENSVCPTKRAL